MFGYSDDPLLGIEKGIVRQVNSGHVAIYIGKIEGVDYVVEALGTGVVKTPAAYFVNSALGEKFLGAKIPRNLSPIQQAKVVSLAKSLAAKNLAYDFDFKKQKGPASGEWTCVGLTEKLYESANISNPNNLGALEYDSNYYAYNITPDGYDNKNVVNSQGDCFAENNEFSKIARRTNMLIPAPELIGYDAGLEYNGERYIFLPYTQFLQKSLSDVVVDISLTSDFVDESVRGKNSTSKIALRWSLINNPISTIKTVATKVKEVALSLKDKLFPSSNPTTIVLNNEIVKKDESKIAASSSKTTAKKSTVASPAKKNTVPKTTATKSSTAKSTAAKSSSTSSSKVSTSKTTAKKTSTTALKATSSKTIVAKTTLKTPVPPKTIIASKPIVSTTTISRLVNTNPTVVVNKSPANSGSGSASSANTDLVNIASVQNNIIDNENNVSTSTENNSDNENISTESASSSDNISSSVATSSATSTEILDGGGGGTQPSYQTLALINRIYSTGENDWVELFNPTNYDFDLALASYRLEKTKAAVTPSLLMRIGNLDDGLYPGGTVIKAHDTYLIVRDEANNYYKNQADAIATRSEFTWAGSGYTLYLGDGAISSSSDQDIIDAVGFGSDATYFLGSSPAAEITDNYVLTKIASTSNNALDFRLLFSNEPGLIATTSTSSTILINTQDWEAYLAALPIDSAGIGDLWHFDECYGNNVKWGVGKWGCALELNYLDTGLNTALNPVYDLDNFTVSFNYKRKSLSRVIFELSNTYNEKFTFLIEEGMIQIEGLPATEWRYYQDYVNDDLWHQVTIVVNRVEHYWAFYIDGQEKIKQIFNAALPDMENMKLWTNQGQTLIDELALWHRALSVNEIMDNYNSGSPYSPVNNREAQRAPILKHFWNFDEGHGSTSEDIIGDLNFDIPEGIWSASGRLNTALFSKSGKNLLLDLNNTIQGKDYSLSLWWRNSTYPNDGRAYIGLRKDDKQVFGFIPNYYRNSYWFNNSAGIFNQGLENLMPYDNLWHHVALTYDSYRYSLNLYIDGEEKASSSLIWLKDGDEPDQLEIISNSDYSEFDELGVWEGALNPKQIQALYANTPAFE
jgi:hypothetical protein